MSKRILSILLSLCMLMIPLGNLSVFAADEINLQFNSMDSVDGMDMEPDVTGTKAISISTDSLEGDGAVKFAYKNQNTGGLFWYFRAPSSEGIDISGATHVIFDMYISDINDWDITPQGDARLGFRSPASSSWDVSAGQVSAVKTEEIFSTLKTGWNHVVMPVTAGESTLVSGIRMYFAAGTAKAGFYTMIDDIRFVNQEYLSSTAYSSEIAQKDEIIQSQEGKVCVQFNNMDSTDRQDMESLDVRDISLTNERIEGSGAVQFGYKAERTAGGHFWYFRCYEQYDTCGVDISGATHILFNIYVSDMTKWTRTGDSGIGLRSIESSTNTGTWDSSAGFVSSSDMNSAFDSLKNGWNTLLLPIDTSSAKSTMLWGIRMFFGEGWGAEGFYTIIDDIRFVNSGYFLSNEYTDRTLREDVISAISRLPSNDEEIITKIDDVLNARELYNALSTSNKAMVYNVDKLIHAETIMGMAQNNISVSFNNLDSANRTAQDASTPTALTGMRVEGTGATVFEIAVDQNTLIWYIYCDEASTATGIDISSTTHVVFDFYVNDLSLIQINQSDKISFEVRNVSTTGGWDSSCTHVTNEDLHNVFDNIKQGWNHVVLPLQPLLTTDAFAFRMVMNNTFAKQGFFTIIDDVRFVNEDYVNGVEYIDKCAAKDVCGMISQLTVSSSDGQIAKARYAYNQLSDNQKSLVCNYDWLTTFEAGEDLAENAPKTFSTIPSSHLADRQETTPGEFSIAVLSDLHYAVNYNGQEQSVFLNSIDWILNNAQKENTLMTLQLGDLTSNNRMAQWQTVRPGFQKLVDGNMPYATVIGNHDIGGRGNAAYNHYLPYSEQVEHNPYLSGAYEEGKTENLYYTFTVNGVNYMVLTLTCYPKEDVLNWADGVIKAHKDHNVILVTHSYLRTVNGIVQHTVETEALAQGFTGESVWNSIIKPNPNVLVTLSAHNSYPSPGENGVGYMTGTNDYGRTVYQFLVPDPQTYEAAYGGLGSCFLMRFSDEGKTVSCEYVATRYDKDFVASGNNNHVITLDPVEADPDLEAARNVIEMINELPETITLDDEDQIKTVRTAYNGLTEDQKTYVTNLEVLVNAEDALEKLKEEAQIEYGDLSGDGNVSAEDSLLVLQASVGKITLAQEQEIKADVSGDGIVDSIDALLILQKIVGKLTVFPIEQD